MGGFALKITIQNYCIRCGLCEDLYPELFRLNTQRDAVDVLCPKVSDELKDKARNAAKDCAVGAIFIR